MSDSDEKDPFSSWARDLNKDISWSNEPPAKTRSERFRLGRLVEEGAPESSTSLISDPMLPRPSAKAVGKEITGGRSDQVKLAIDQIVQTVRGLTRFDEASLDRESDSVRTVSGAAFWPFSVTVSIKKGYEEKGRLPSLVKQVDSQPQLDEVAERTRKVAYDALPQRIQAWVRKNEMTDRQLTVSDCFDGTQTFGYQYPCSTCRGVGWTQCSCDKGQIECPKCSGRGSVDCSNCKVFFLVSTRVVTCRGCGGKKKINGQVCRTCNGKGHIPCPKCSGTGKTTCDKCNGHTKIQHGECGGTGKLDCRPCGKTGYFHVLRTVECTVEAPFRVELKDQKPEVVRQLTSRNLGKLRELASVRQKAPTVRGTCVEREYEFECVVTEIRLQVVGQLRELIGFGERAKIFDYQAIVSDLLETDLIALEENVAKTPYRPWGNPAGLLTATKQFLASELNVQMNEPRWIDRRVVTKEYVERAKSSSCSALQKLFLSRLRLAILVTALLPMIIFIVSHFAGWREVIGGWAFAPPMVGAIVSWILLERNARRRLVATFEGNAPEKVNELMRRYRILWRIRGVMLLLTLALLLVMAAILRAPTP